MVRDIWKSFRCIYPEKRKRNPLGSLPSASSLTPIFSCVEIYNPNYKRPLIIFIHFNLKNIEKDLWSSWNLRLKTVWWSLRLSS